MGHVLVQFILIAVTASTTTVAALVAFPAVRAWVGDAAVGAVPARGVRRRPGPGPAAPAYHRVPGCGASTPCTTPAGAWTGWRDRAYLLEILLTRSVVLMPLVVLGQPLGDQCHVVLVGLQAVLAHANLRLDFAHWNSCW